ncbi:MAG: polysaccharide biosynthesis/export family protein [Candidatus Solibacter usitatus]|nr:polysaccharide biosynthesis/export family protein [Candidatus Solibacter usitatus]
MAFLVTVGCALLVASPAKEKKKKEAPVPQASQALAAGASSGGATTGAIPEAPKPTVDPNTYVIGAKDQILVQVWKEPELSGPKTVRPDGKITLQLLGEVHAAGLTPEALAKVIRDGLSAKYMNKPEVTVTVLGVGSKDYYLQGEANRSGAVPLLVPTTVLEALMSAGGFKDFAKKSKIFVVRGKQRFYFNYNEVIKGKKMEQNIYLQPGDIIVVP